MQVFEPEEIDGLLVLRERLPSGDWTVQDVSVRVAGHPVATSGSTAAAAYLATAADLAPRLVTVLRETATLALLHYMGHLSLKYTGEPWADGLANALWKAVQDGPQVMDEDEVTQLEWLTDVAGGWFATPDEFLDAEAWQTRYEEG